jgi:hypothetical protein
LGFKNGGTGSHVPTYQDGPARRDALRRGMHSDDGTLTEVQRDVLLRACADIALGLAVRARR